MNDIFERSKGLIGTDAFNKLENMTICIAGLGGVGGTAFMSLLRSGVKNFVLIDMDVVSESNLNRQVLFSLNDIGKSKVEVAKNYAISINSSANIQYFNENVNNLDLNILLKNKVDYIVDAIDDVNGKIKLCEFAKRNDIPLIMSLGMANRLDPSQVFITKLGKTTVDPLAKKIRYEVKQLGLDANDIVVVFSKEEPIKEGNKLHSMIMVPSSAGLNIAYHIIDNVCNNK